MRIISSILQMFTKEYTLLIINTEEEENIGLITYIAIGKNFT